MKKQHAIMVSMIAGYVTRLRSLPLFIGGTPLSTTNRTIFVRMVEAWLFLIEDLMLRLGLCQVSRDAKRANFVNALESIDLTQLFPFLEGIYSYLIEDESGSVDAFKQHLLNLPLAPLCQSGLLSPINTAVYSFLIETNGEEKSHLLASIAQFLRFPRKLELQDIGLEAQALESYKETEKELAAVCYDENEHILKGMSKIIVEWFEGFHIENLRPSHGSGSVAEGSLTLAEKFDRCNVDQLLAVALRTNVDPLSHLGYFPRQPGTDLVRCSRTIFVPKTATKLRTISMEPVSLQYIQQGVMREIYGFIERHPFLGSRIQLSDQGQNQVLALKGSIDHTYGTIDLSHASDSVSWDLVRRLFRPVPLLYKWLLATRSKCTLLPTGETVTLHKFAPMGSALCFPIECIVFAAAVEYASRVVCTRERVASQLWSVYGDDLVVPSHIYDYVEDVLEACGFTVNRTKSYNTGKYRESCGKEYYDGRDISPLYYRTPFYNKRPSPSVYSSWLSGANNALLHRLPIYRLYLINKALDTPFKPYFTYSPEVSPGLFSPSPTNFHVRSRWNKDYQRMDGRFTVVKCKQRDCELDDDTLSYFVKLVELARRPIGESSHLGESPSAIPLHGCVEYFSSTLLPMSDWYRVDKTLTTEWWET